MSFTCFVHLEGPEFKSWMGLFLCGKTAFHLCFMLRYSLLLLLKKVNWVFVIHDI